MVLIAREKKKPSFRLRLIPRVLRDVEGVSVGGLSILGEEVSSPVCVAPTAMQKMAHSDGELATARACAKHGKWRRIWNHKVDCRHTAYVITQLLVFTRALVQG